MDTMYDDSQLKKRVKCLTSAQLLCFVIGMAGLGTAIITLLKVGNDEEIIASIAYTNDEIEILRHEILELQMKLKELQAERFGLSDDVRHQDGSGAAGEGVEAAATQPVWGGNATAFEEPPHPHQEVPARHHEGGPAHRPEEEGYPAHQDQEGQGHAHHHEAHLALPPHEGSEEDSREHPSDEEDALTVRGGELLCDDADLCTPAEGSGILQLSIEDYLQGHLIEDFGSGGGLDECAPFPRPTCPEGATICYNTKGRCPIPTCCFETPGE